MSLESAVSHQPDKKTYVIRIGSERYTYSVEEPLKDSPFYVHIAKYLFDDVGPMSVHYHPENKLISEETAGQIITDFSHYKDNIDCLLVHGMHGRNRSPAVGIALNEIFDLGHSTNKLKDKYSESTWYAYNLLTTVAKETGFLKSD